MESYPISPELTSLSRLRSLRWSTVIIAIANIIVIPIAGYLSVFIAAQCGHSKALSFFVVAVFASTRILSMVGAGIAQEATAVSIISYQLDDSAAQAVIRQERRLKYKRWLWWTRFGMVITMLQFCGASYLMFTIIKDFSYGREASCFLVQDADKNRWRNMLVIVLLILVWLLVSIQFCIGSDILRWRSFYATHDNAWKAHYSEVFDHGIREALCCLGRIKYLSVLEEDEVYSVARLLGDLVAYRAAGTGHLELLAGLALLQKHDESTVSYEQLMEAPEDRIQEAAVFHQFAEAAYTGPLLDFGRNPVLFPCAWLYRQGILSPWTCRRRPFLEGDNWWRGHSAAFLKYINLPSSVLRHGRVSQVRREAAYFIVVLHDSRSVVIAVRGTETPEDLLTDGLCRECVLTNEDLDGLINSEHLRMDVKELVISSFPHYGHSGIVESARELCTQVDGKSDHSEGTGFLSSLMGVGGECHGYNLRIVGHSLGGAVATLLGIMLHRRYPNLHVYAYGALPCVDSIVAEACSDFVTSIVLNDEFSARLSVCSVLRLRTAAIAAFTQDSSADSAMIYKFARRILQTNQLHEAGINEGVSPPYHTETLTAADCNQTYRRRQYRYALEGSGPSQDILMQEKNDFAKSSFSEKFGVYLDENFYEAYHPTVETLAQSCIRDMTEVFPSSDLLVQIAGGEPSSRSLSKDPQEMFLPGFIIHIIPESRQKGLAIWKFWNSHGKDDNFRAYVADRETFKDIVVSPYMFLDHLPWRCHYALQKVLETQRACGELGNDFSRQTSIV